MLALANKLSLNTRPIYRFVNEHSVDFDGVDDRIITDGADTVAQPTTYSFWCKSSTTAENKGVFGHGSYNMGTFHFNIGGTRPLLELGTSYARYWNDTPAQDDGEWHHWVVYSDPNNILNSKLYVDGVLQTVNATTSSGSTTAYTQSLTIGSDRQVGGNSFEGKIDEFAVYDRELTQDEITRMYNTYYSPNRVANGNFSQIGNEEVTNGDFSQEGSELVTNGDFATDSDWALANGSSISGGSLTLPDTGTALQTGIPTNTSVKLNIQGSGTVTFRLNTGVGFTSISLPQIIYVTTGSSGGRVQLNNVSGSEVTIDNVSVKEVGQDWTFFGEAEFTSLGARIYSSSGGQSYIKQTTLTNTKSYKLTYEITDSTQGSLKLINVNGLSDFPIPSTVGTHTVYFTANNNELFIYRNIGVTDVTIDNISVKEVGQHWTFGTGWSMGDGVAICDGSQSSNSNLQQNTGVPTVGKTFKISYKVSNHSSGDAFIGMGGYNYAGTNISEDGQFTQDLTVTNVSSNTSFYITADSSFAATIDNIVVEELKHDATNLMLNAGAYQSANPLITSTKSMEFDGADDYLVSESPTIGTEFTVSAWINTSDVSSSGGSYAAFFATGEYDVSTTFKIGITTNGVIEIWQGNSAQGTGTSNVADGKWHLINYTKNSTEGKIYVDGVLETTTAYTTILTFPNIYVGIGGNNSPIPDNGGYFDGLVTELGVYDRVLTSLEVASLYNQGMPTNLLVNRNNYQSGNPTVFNTKQVDFDGSDDFLNLGNVLNLGTEDFSISLWVKPETNNNEYLIGKAQDSDNRWYFRITPSNKLEFFTKVGGSATINWIGQTSINPDVWSHFVLSVDRNGTVYGFVNAVQDANTTSGNVTSLDNTGDLTIGHFSTFSGYFEGEMSQVGIWNSTLTADEVSSLYNHGLPVDLTTDQAAYESSSNLVGYWRMGSGTLDTYPLIADQTNATLGTELVTNGNFATDLSGWSGQAGRGSYSWDNGRAKITNDDASSYPNLSQSITTVVGKVYKITATVEIGTATLTEVRAYSNSNIGSQQLSTDGTIEFYIIADDTDFTLHLYLFETGNTGHYCYFDNVSVKQVNGNPAIMSNTFAATAIENGSPYAQLIPNGTFESNVDGWATNNANATFTWQTDKTALFTSTSFAYVRLNPALSLPSGTYKVSFDILSFEGTLSNLHIGLGTSGNTVTTTGSYTYNTTASGSTEFQIRPNSGGTGSIKIDNIRVEEVNTGLQGYWKMGDGTNDEYPVIYDQTNPTNGSELVINGDFATDSDWSFSGGGIEISNGKLNFTSTTREASQSISIVNGKTYKVNYEISDYTSGDVRVELGSSNGLSRNAIGIYTEYIVSTGTSTVQIDAVSVFTGSIDNISVKEVQGNPATMTNMVEGNITNQYPLTKIRNYYRMGDGILDGYPIIQDQTSPNLAHIPTTNTLTYSEDFSQYSTGGTAPTLTTGQLAPDGTLTATKVSGVIGSTSLYIPSVSSMTATKSIYARTVSGTGTAELLSYYGNTNNTFTLTEEWQRFELTGSSATGGSNFYAVDFRNLTTTLSELIIWGGQSEEQSQATAYLKSDGIAAVRKSSTTNLVPYSEDFSQSIYLKQNVTLTSGFISPFGTPTAKKLIEGTNNGSHFIYSNVFLSGLRFFSVYLKKAERDYAWITDSQNGNGININLTNGTFTSINNPTNPKIENVGNDWYRCSFGSNVSSVWQLRIDTAIDSGRDYQGDGVSGIYIFGAQLEDQTQAETYAKTTGLPVTIDLFTENNYGTMTNMSASDIVEDTPNN